MALAPTLVLVATTLLASAASVVTVFVQADDVVSAAAVREGVSVELAQERASRLSALHYQLRFSLPQDQQAPIAGQATISFELRDNSRPLQLDFRSDSQSLHRVLSNGQAVAAEVRAEHIVLPAATLRRGANEISLEFTAGSSSLNRNPEYVYTLFVPDRARTAFPLFDQPDLKASYQLTLELPASWAALANAPVTEVATAAGRSVHRFATTERISSYLVAFVAGRFQTITRQLGDRTMRVLHRETDSDKLARNLDAIFALHRNAIDWMEHYTGIPYPYQKLDFALIPTFQYGGMEHVGAIDYRAKFLLLDAAPSADQLLARASLIAHEVAHMWFGNLVTMRWFNDVWTKEVFANFMAAKIVNPGFPEIDHDLGFLVRHYPKAYAVERSAGANPIRQQLLNLNEAGQMYGPVIYNKAPIMMRQLELLVGEEPFRRGMQQYLQQFAHANATWPELVSILDKHSPTDLAAWSETWVDAAGRPEFAIEQASDKAHTLAQLDPAGLQRVWPQRFAIRSFAPAQPSLTVDSVLPHTPLAMAVADTVMLFNADGKGYGLFPAQPELLQQWPLLTRLERGELLLDLYENLLAGNSPAPADYFQQLLTITAVERNQLLVKLVLDQLKRIYISLLSPAQQQLLGPALEGALWRALHEQETSSGVKLFFEAYRELASSPVALQRLHAVWAGKLAIDQLELSENDFIRLAEELSIRQPAQAAAILAQQLQRIENPDNLRRLEFIADSLSPSEAVRDRFFNSLADENNREIETWVNDALRNLHHPTRLEQSRKYIPASLALVQELQQTGDIFFPTRWLVATMINHRSAYAVNTVTEFLARRPQYNAQLRMKILQAADMPMRANKIVQRQLELEATVPRH